MILERPQITMIVFMLLNLVVEWLYHWDEKPVRNYNIWMWILNFITMAFILYQWWFFWK